MQNRAFFRREQAGQQIEKGGLAGAVGTDDAGDVVFVEREIDVIDRHHRTEAFGYGSRLEDFSTQMFFRVPTQTRRYGRKLRPQRRD